MSSDEDEEAFEEGLSILGGQPPRTPRSRLVGKLKIGRRKSTGQEFLHSTSRHSPNGSPAITDPVPKQSTRVSRSHSNANVLCYKVQWADALICQEPMQTSLINLRQTVEVYEKQATNEKWGELWRLRAEVAELDTLAKAALDKQQSRKTILKGMERFSTVALEYSKLLDVVMNQCPEYVALAWGVTKLLLVANINHSKLKQNVESHLVSIGEQLGLVNQLIAYSPTDKMVEAVAALYASFSKFLTKALRCYAKSKLASVFEAFAFPWEAKFQKVVSQIDAQIRRIQELASASHFHVTLCNQNLLQSLWEHQQEERASSRQESGSDQLRMEIKEEMKREIGGLLENFNVRWVQRFDDLLLQRTALCEGNDGTNRTDIFSSAAQLALPVSTPQTYLADSLSNPQTLLNFRNEVFPQLQPFDQRESYIRASGRHLTTYDWQHCVALLRHPSMRTWMSSELSSILWVDTYQGHKLDWASVLLTRLTDEYSRLDCSMALSHFCQGHSAGSVVSTAAILIQSLIFQTISIYHAQFTIRATGLTQQRFQEAQSDVEKLWALFLDVLRLVANGKCVWLVIDHVDILQRETNLRGLEHALALLRNLNALADDPAMTVKILITARIRDAARLSTKIAEARILAKRHAIITVPRGHHRQEATLLAKSSQRISRLQEPNTSLSVPASLASVDSLLSNNDSDTSSEEENTAKAKHTAEAKPKPVIAKLDIASDTGESDSASLFDEFESSDDSEPMTARQEAALHPCSSDNSSDDDIAQAKPFSDFAEIKWKSSDEQGNRRDQCVSPVTPKIVVAFSEETTRTRGSRSASYEDGVEASAKETEEPPALSTPRATANFGNMSPINSGLPSESDSDESFI